jgi:hypothetical protein
MVCDSSLTNSIQVSASTLGRAGHMRVIWCRNPKRGGGRGERGAYWNKGV